jgi:hypothetical protein
VSREEVEELEVSYGQLGIKSRGLLSAKIAFVGSFTFLYLFDILPGLRNQPDLATLIYLLGVIVFVGVFFGSLSHTFSRKPRKQHKQKTRKRRVRPSEEFGH